MFGGEYGGFRLDQEITIQNFINKASINPNVLYGSEKKWIHIAFCNCPEFVQLISDLCTNCENQLRKERGIPGIGEQWKSETEIYAFVKEILASFDVIRHCSPICLSPMHLDVYVPELSFAVEYQGQQHYMPIFLGAKIVSKKQKFGTLLKINYADKTKFISYIYDMMIRIQKRQLLIL